MQPLWHQNFLGADVFLGGLTRIPKYLFIFCQVLQSTMADVSAEVYRTNKLLEIENLDWQNQLKCAVGGF